LEVALVTTPLLLPTWSLDGVTLNAVDAAGIEWIVTRDSGWYSAPGERLDQDVKPVSDGVYDGPSYRDARLITLEGTVSGPTRIALDRALRRFAAVAATSSTAKTLTVAEPDLTFAVSVKRARAPQIDRLTETAARWQLHLVAPDPRRYSAVQQSASTVLPGDPLVGLDFTPSGGWAGLDFTPSGYAGLDLGTPPTDGLMTLTNNGTIDTGVVFEVRGPLTAPITIVNQATSQQLTYSINGAAGEILTIDTAARTVMLGGTASRRAQLTTAQWWTLPPGTTVVSWRHGAPSNTTASLTARWRDAYM
jgi:hypothetical protein